MQESQSLARLTRVMLSSQHLPRNTIVLFIPKDTPSRLTLIALLVCVTNLAPLAINFLYILAVLSASLTEKLILSVSYILNFVVIAWLTIHFCQKHRWAMYGIALTQFATCINHLLLLLQSVQVSTPDQLTDKPFLTGLFLAITGFNLYLLLSPASQRFFSAEMKPHIRTFLLAIQRLHALSHPEHRPAETDNA